MRHVTRVTDASYPDAAVHVNRILQESVQHDGIPAINEDTELHLKNRGITHASLWLGYLGDKPVGFALQIGPELNLVVAPSARGKGVGKALMAVLVEANPDGGVSAWSHADHPWARALAARWRMNPSRELLIMTRPAADPIAPVTVPAGVRVRSFRQSDLQSLLALNATAFAAHPEQSGMTAADFLDRTREEWFDPDGLLMAVKDSATTKAAEAADKPLDNADLLGFHWTKVHRPDRPNVGEVYVVAVAPEAAGKGLGTVLTSLGLEYLVAQGVSEIELYVEADNHPAIAVYHKLGFKRERTEVQYLATP